MRKQRAAPKFPHTRLAGLAKPGPGAPVTRSQGQALA